MAAAAELRKLVAAQALAAPAVVEQVAQHLVGPEQQGRRIRVAVAVVAAVLAVLAALAAPA